MARKEISKKDLARIKELDLLSYFQNYEPDELIRYSRNEYGTKTYSSLRMSNGLWTSWANSIGGRSALDFFIKIKQWGFLEAAHYLKDLIENKTPVKVEQQKRVKHHLKLPRRNENDDIVINYLVKERCIDKEIVNYCIENYLLYEAQKDHSAIFIGYDPHRLAKYACKRGTDSDVKQDIFGSDKAYSLSIPNPNSNELHVFESAIDLLSYMTLQKRNGKSYLNTNYLSLSGATTIGSSVDESTVPIALETFLKDYPNIKFIRLHLDNDKAGKDTVLKIMYHYGKLFHIVDEPPSIGKDVNELLIKKINRKKYFQVR
ncbi:DUF3991 domain-containing protein [Thomasclavelia ramosa]|uniref:DUF3991 domain-containing protein n=1 Tax=Thomasclavelia ramosa TaxID=1547 RepID=UPI001D096714|nr:DUF3991 domain-containing protein [Thomasclavelia ramosa]MCB6435844.1 DUF3991 and toprim domain-containing protein [Thomasclavelia ramosa]MCB6458893.1 DUF3991 and toprim domain-containing protein [Thomasclavelia ramosa]MCB6597127.1 DUF3991 and toprim domain-containing protein [Thomasclavelia ramosa]MCB6600614.1 DUF3991 and toprim domain-containing protein [Thomasclavelia ramosa]MCB6618707.1 DUF3991 and toprim domain-containing protein [Thomasclavelia ramosa]